MNPNSQIGYPLPKKGVLFLGGHHNMTKKLQQQFPKWTFVSDDQLKRCTTINHQIVFYWTAHSSHKLMQHVYKRLPKDSVILYVTATNIPLLVSEMQRMYKQNDNFVV
jgi:hypothetical protein